MNLRYLVAAFALVTFQATADNSTLDAAIGGAIGGGAGAAIGNEVGGRDGAIIGGALGGAVGAAVNTDDDDHRHSSNRKARYDDGHDHYYRGHHHRHEHHRHEYHKTHFCPPGQAKKGNC
jgi:outer membrane lipoprotein SlyB